MSDSPSDMTGNSSGKPPACRTPRLTAAASPRRWTLQLTSSLQELQIPITGRPRKASLDTPVDFSHDRWRNPSRSRRSNHSRERRPSVRPYPSPLRIVGISFLSRLWKPPCERGMVDHASRPGAAAAGAAPATTVRAGREGRVGDVEQLAARAQREQECAPVVAAFDAEALEVVTRVDVEGPEPAAS